MVFSDNDLDIVQSRRREYDPDFMTRHLSAIRPPDLRTPEQVALETEYLYGLAWMCGMPESAFIGDIGDWPPEPEPDPKLTSWITFMRSLPTGTFAVD